MRWALLLLVALPFAASEAARHEEGGGEHTRRNGRSAHVNYMTECQGCHLPDGRGTPGSVPAMKGKISRFLQVEGGRAYIVQVPGSANSKLSDADLADVLNWIITRMDSPTPGRFVPYTPSEVASYRAHRLKDVAQRRAALLRQVTAHNR